MSSAIDEEMDWTLIRERLGPIFQEIVDTARSTHQGLIGGWGFQTHMSIVDKATVGASFVYDKQQEHEDLIIWFHVGTALAWLPAEVRVEGRDIAICYMERGDCKEVAVLDPVLLPENPASKEYEAAVLDYADRAALFLRVNMNVILEALKEPYWK